MEEQATYTVREVKPDIYEVTNFIDGRKEPHSVYNVRKTPRSYTCDCPGFWRQRNKDEHKHCLIVKFWVENLEKELGCALWFDGDDIEYYKFVNRQEELEQWLKK